MLCRSSIHTTSQYYRHIKQKLKNLHMILILGKTCCQETIWQVTHFLSSTWLDRRNGNKYSSTSLCCLVLFLQFLCRCLMYWFCPDFFGQWWRKTQRVGHFVLTFAIIGFYFLSLSDSLVNISNPAVFVSSQCFLFPNIWEYWRGFIWLELFKIYFERKITKCCFIF